MIRLQVVSDFLITLAYFSIPLTLIYFIRKRKDLHFTWIFLCFAVFIVACGATHLMEIVNVWHPMYWVSGGIKALTAASSIITAILLVRLIPQALSLPSVAERDRLEADLQERNSQLQSAAQAKNRFLANMSHELRTPLNGILGFSQLLSTEKPGPINSTQREYLGDILTSGRHLLQLINDIPDLAKVESGKMVLNLETFSLRKAIDEVCATARLMIEKKGIQLCVEISPELNPITLDEQKIKQVLYNLLSNAIKFTNSGGRIDITAIPLEQGRFKMAVRDTGIGIKAEDLQRLFKEFEQIDSSITRKYEGTGLGLALTRRLVELFEGTISVESEPGHGSVFTVTLPLSIEAKVGSINN